MKTSTHFHTESIPKSELILRPDGAVYHLALQPEQLANTIIIVGDPNRVAQISKRFDKVEHRVGEREFHTHTGFVGNTHVSVVSSGIGVDNIDIVLNELDALKNIDFQTRQQKETPTQLNILRLGTSGTMQTDISVGDFVASRYALGNDGVPYFYRPQFEVDEEVLMEDFMQVIEWPERTAQPYAVRCSDRLIKKFEDVVNQGITLTANGFYGPQGRSLRLPLANAKLTESMAQFSHNNLRITNYEMECAGIYALGSMLGHEVLTICTILANRATKQFASDPQKHTSELIDMALSKITT